MLQGHACRGGYLDRDQALLWRGIAYEWSVKLTRFYCTGDEPVNAVVHRLMRELPVLGRSSYYSSRELVAYQPNVIRCYDDQDSSKA